MAIGAGLAGAGAVSSRRPNKRGGDSRVKSGDGEESPLATIIRQKNEENAVVIYSKSWCPFCQQVKSLFEKLNVDAVAIELDGIVEEQEVQGELEKLTGQRTVPNVFIGGKHIGGCDDCLTLSRSGELEKLLKEAGAI